MDTNALVSNIEKGKVVLNALEHAHIVCKTAFWLYEDGEWKLVLAMPLVETHGSRAAYAAVQRALAKSNKEGIVPLRQIKVIGTSNLLIRKLAGAARATGPNLNMRVTNAVIDNELIEDAYIYRST